MIEGNNYKIDNVEFHLRLKKAEVKMFLKHVLKSSWEKDLISSIYIIPQKQD